MQVAAGQSAKKIAAIAFVYTPGSHAFAILGKYLDGYDSFVPEGADSYFLQQKLPEDRRSGRPNSQIVSLHVAQPAERDLSRQISRGYRIPLYRTIEEGLTLGTGELAVDGILLIGEHGEYPTNDKGQKLYPRFEAFLEIVDVFRRTGRSVPVFNDKHLSYSWIKAQRMVQVSRELGFPFMAGSSLPVTWRRPPMEVPYGAPVKHAVGIAMWDLDSYGFHLLEAVQSLVERRRGGETGIRSVQCLEGAAVWSYLEKTPWAKRLFDETISRSQTRKPDLRDNAESPAVFLLDYNDGLRTASFMLDRAVRDFTVAVEIEGVSRPLSTLMYLEGFRPFVYYHFVCQVKSVEKMFETGLPTYPVERTLLTSGALDFLLESRLKKHRRIQTPELSVRYQTPDRSHFCDQGPPHSSNPDGLPILQESTPR